LRVDVLHLQRFYASRLGRVTQRMIARRLGALWPQADALDVLGIGYPMPYLEAFRAGARRAAAMAPAGQGAECWPSGGGGMIVLADEARLPFIDSLFDRVLVVHALEEAENAQAMLREVWRVMSPEGRLMVIAANRLGLWARADATPFGHGRPYNRDQLWRLLSDAMFEPLATARSLYLPPIGWAAKLAMPWERAGETLWPAFGGLLMMEAVKRFYAQPSPQGRKVVPARTKPAHAVPGDARGGSSDGALRLRRLRAKSP
jgi:SAM-dependent methyltransferase